MKMILEEHDNWFLINFKRCLVLRVVLFYVQGTWSQRARMFIGHEVRGHDREYGARECIGREGPKDENTKVHYNTLV